MLGAIHGLQGVLSIAVLERKHIVAEAAPVTAALPQRTGHQLWRSDLEKPCTLHFATNVALQEQADGCAPGMPECGPWRILLLMKQVEFRAEASVIVNVHEFLLVLSESEGTHKRNGPRPLMAGPVRLADSVF